MLLSHQHPDHIAGALQVAAHYQIPIRSHPLTAPLLPFSSQPDLEDGLILELEGLRLSVLHTPGHAPGHLCFKDEQTSSVLAGDMVSGLGSIFVGIGGGNMKEYLRSLERLEREEPLCLIPAHGPPIGGAQHWLQFYRRHRLQRESAVCVALEAEPQSLEVLLAQVYQELPEQIRSGPLGELASLSLQAHLEKLEEEGRAERQGERWRAL